MKRIKTMLLSLALVAVVGSTLAFKAKFENSFCTAEPNFSAPFFCDKACTNFTPEVRIGFTGYFVCTTEYDGDGCHSAQCENIHPVQLEADNAGK